MTRHVTPQAITYETVAASQTAQVLGPNGASGDYIKRLIIIPAATTPGVVTLIDGVTSIPIFVGGASSVADLKPIVVELDLFSVSGPWKLTTGLSVSAVAVGVFS